jgi:hypothetical protein
VNTVPDLNKAAAIAATGQTKAAAAPRIKLLSHGFSIDHPDSELGEQLMAEALGVTDRDAMHGILRQLLKASVNGERPDAVNRPRAPLNPAIPTFLGLHDAPPMITERASCVSSGYDTHPGLRSMS